MHQLSRVVALACLGVLASISLCVPARSCTTFCLGDGDLVFGKNYDWAVEEGLLVVNKRGVQKMALGSDEDGARWISRHGSVTFNQYGRELPSGGMNEAGLVIELMWLDETRYPKSDSRPALGNLQWIQYQLDRSATVEDVIRSDADVRITGLSSSRIHFLVADRTGDVATIEFLRGQLVAHRGATLPVRALTNHTYSKSLAHFEAHRDARRGQHGHGSLERFARVAGRLEQQSTAAPVDEAFSILSNVAQDEFTKWSIVYDVAERTIHYKTLAAPVRKRIGLASCDFDCAPEVRVIDLNDAQVSGDVAGALHPYDADEAFALLVPAFHKVDFLRRTPESSIRDLSRFALGLDCVGGDASEDVSRETDGRSD